MDQINCGVETPLYDAESLASRLILNSVQQKAINGRCDSGKERSIDPPQSGTIETSKSSGPEEAVEVQTAEQEVKRTKEFDSEQEINGAKESDLRLVRTDLPTGTVVKKPEPPRPEGWDVEDKTEAYLEFLHRHWGVFDQDDDRKLSRQEVDSLAADETATEFVRETARFLQKDFDGIRALDDKTNKVSNEIERSDLFIFADGYRQISMDRKYFDDAKKLAIENFDRIDSNKNGEISEKEIEQFVKKNELSERDKNAAEYLKHRLEGGDQVFFDPATKQKMRNNQLPFVGSNYWVSDSGSSTKEQILSMDLSQRISQTERSLYVANVANGYHQAGKVIGMTAGVLGGFLIAEAVPVPPLTATIPFSAMMFGAMAGGEVGLYFGRRRGTSLYEQHHKGALTRLMGT